MSYQQELEQALLKIHHDTLLTRVQRLILSETLEYELRGNIPSTDSSKDYRLFHRTQDLLANILHKKAKAHVSGIAWWLGKSVLKEDLQNPAIAMLHTWMDLLDKDPVVHTVEKPNYIVSYKIVNPSTWNPWNHVSDFPELIEHTNQPWLSQTELKDAMDEFISRMTMSNRYCLSSTESLHRMNNTWVLIKRSRKYQWMDTYSRYLEHNKQK